MKTYLLKPMVVVCLCLLTASFTFAADNYKMVKVKAPFPMQPIKLWHLYTTQHRAVCHNF